MAKGDIIHIEFPSDDPARARAFYEAVAGWQFSEVEGMPGYWTFATGEGRGGAIGRRGESVGPVVRAYITVDDLEDAVATAQANGGTLVDAPTEVPGMGRFASILDPEGSEIGLWEELPA